jgi:hypothetical protein
VELFNWIGVGTLQIPFAFLIDQLSLIMLLIITGVGSLIHIYSIGYMKHDEGFGKFFAFLNLFLFSMLLLVMGSNYPMMFIGWEGVGLCSYLLIGFWNKNTNYNNAARKAFIMNRIGDLGFLLGIFLIFFTLETVEYTEVFAKAAATFDVDDTTVIAITLLLFVGAMGKSAQIPLYTWLPDAMAGPTPVSALIHAATMVTAGIYMVVRSNVLYTLAPTYAERRGGHRPGYGPAGGHHRHPAKRHQESTGLLHREPVGVYVPGPRRGGIFVGHVPRNDPRLLQGPAVPRRRQRDPRHERRTGHPAHGRPAEVPARYVRYLPDCHHCHFGHSALCGLFLQGRNPDARV